MNIFGVESGLMRAVSKFTDCIILSVMFIISCIPIITIGTASSALYHTAFKVLRQDRGYIVRDYIDTFRENFKKTTLVWLVTLVIGVVIVLDIYVVSIYVPTDSPLAIFSVIFMAAFILWFVWISYLFPYMSRFENTGKQSMKNAILMAIAHLPSTVLMLILAAAVAVMMYIAIFTIFIFPAVYALLQSFILERVFRKYISEEE